jgi:hypothetical protein
MKGVRIKRRKEVILGPSNVGKGTDHGLDVPYRYKTTIYYN